MSGLSAFCIRGGMGAALVTIALTPALAADPVDLSAGGAVIDLGGAASTETALPTERPASPLAIAVARDAGVVGGRPAIEPALAVLEAPGGLEAKRLVGDYPEASFRLFLPPGSKPDALIVAYRSSIDVLPERSSLTVTINGSALPPITPAASSDVAEAILPADGLRPGDNAIHISASHHHRIYCGALASFSLWTEIDLARSGARIVESPPAGPPVSALLSALAASGKPLEIRVGPDVAASSVRAAYLALARAMRGRVPPPRITNVWNPTDGEPSGLRITILNGSENTLDLVTGGDGAPVLRIVASTEDPSWISARLGEVMPTSLPSFAPQEPTISGETELTALGVADAITLRGRYDSEGVNFRMPDDWLALSSKPAMLTLRYAVAAGYSRGSLMTVKLNGRAIQLLPLDLNTPPRSPLGIAFDAQILRRGVNALEFELMSPGDPPDLPCAEVTDPPVTTISGATTLTLPGSARMAIPGMAVAVLGVDGSHVDALDDTEAGIAGAAAFAPLDRVGAAEPSRLHILRLHEAGRAPLAPLGVTSEVVRSALVPDRRDHGASEGNSPWLAKDGGFDWRFPLDVVMTQLEALDARPLERRAPLDVWLSETPGDAALLQPDPSRPLDLWLIIGPGVDPGKVARALDAGRRSGRGPDGQVAVLTASGEWRSWFSRDAAPQLPRALSFGGFRDVAGNLASWAPELFALGGLGVTWLSALVGVVLIRSAREGVGK